MPVNPLKLPLSSVAVLPKRLLSSEAPMPSNSFASLLHGMPSQSGAPSRGISPAPPKDSDASQTGFAGGFQSTQSPGLHTSQHSGADTLDPIVNVKTPETSLAESPGRETATIASTDVQLTSPHLLRPADFAKSATHDDRNELSAPIESAQPYEPPPLQTYGFDDLGVFGIDGSTRSDLAGSPMQPSAYVLAMSATPSSSSHQAESFSSSKTDMSESASTTSNVESSMPAAGLPFITPTHIANEPSIAAVTMPELTATGTKNDDATSSVHSIDTEKFPLTPSAKQTTSAPALVVAGTNDALMIAARSTYAADVDAVRIRQMIEATAAEFGMRVGELHLNGRPSGAAKGRNA